MFLYEFNGRPYYSKRPEFIRADHADDLAAAFGFSEIGDVFGLNIPEDKLEEARQTEAAFMPYLASFAKTGYDFCLAYNIEVSHNFLHVTSSYTTGRSFTTKLIFSLELPHSVPSGEALPHWPELREDGSYMRIDNVPELRHNYQPEQMKFWQETVPAFQAAATESRDEL